MVGVLLFKYKITSSFRARCTSWVLCVGNGVTARAAPCSRLPGPRTGARGAAGGQQPLGVRGLGAASRTHHCFLGPFVL